MRDKSRDRLSENRYKRAMAADELMREMGLDYELQNTQLQTASGQRVRAWSRSLDARGNGASNEPHGGGFRAGLH